MRNLCIASLVAVACLPAASLDSNTVTVTATRTVGAQPDQVVLSVTLTTAPDAGLDDILARLKGTGLTAGDLTGVYTSSLVPAAPSNRYLDWYFGLTVTFAKMKDTLKVLNQLQAAMPVIQNAPSLTFSINGMRYSADAQAAQACPYPALVSDARRQADAMASAAGMKAGPIVSVSDGGPSDIAVPTALARTGDFSISPIFIYDAYSGLPPSGSGVFGLVGFPYPLSAPPPACLLTVQFKLLQ